MIIVHGKIPIHGEQRDVALKLAQQMADATRAEYGCITYEFYIGLSDPNMLMLFQEWENTEALMAHFETEHMQEFLEALPEIVSGDIVTRRYAVHSMEEEETMDLDVDSPTIH
ncbi:MAG TPA: hypothetical protein DER02_09315 [Gammaproteobacteria bacterium]|nr:hypothetical protein [Gammaproteobacteria bacterium]